MLRILVTGGTFDKEYDEISGRLYFLETHLPELLRRGRSRLEVTVETLCMMDSLDMTEEDRAEILRACRESPEERLVITHGTDTMVETAAYLARGLAGSGRTVVLTGAMIPFAFGSSDGLFNLGSALSFAQVLDPGVYVAMNGRYFPWNDVRKNRELGIFEALG
ncbi:MAG: asparaginase [Thermoanaerobaculia bacterium]